MIYDSILLITGGAGSFGNAVLNHAKKYNKDERYMDYINLYETILAK